MATAAFSLVSSEPPPLNVDEHGVVRVGGTRVTLDTVLTAYKQHAGAEEIAEAFPVLELADVHAAIAYYLRHRQEVEAYLQEGVQKADEMRKKIEMRHDPEAIRQRIAAKKAEKVLRS